MPVTACRKNTYLVKESWTLYYVLSAVYSGECDTRSWFMEYAVGKGSILGK